MHPSVRKWLLALLAVAALAGSSFLSPGLDRQRRTHELLAAPIEESARPSMIYAPLLALGRAPLVDYLWLRATKLKEQGRVFDAYQLSRMICELQPRFASVWAFQAWNMSYNISVTFKSPEERWRWVKNGIDLLKDKGIPLNPSNTQLYKELAWIFFHKVGDFTDEMHFYYKLQLALIMEDVLGPPPPGWARPGRVDGDYYRDYPYATLAAAPETWEELIERPGVMEIVNRLGEFGHDATTPGVYLGLLQALREDKVKVPNARAGDEENRIHALKAFMAELEREEARKAMENFWRAKRLREEWRLDPQRIVDIQEAFGVTFDFRLAEAHALYWANMALEKGADKRVALDVQKLNTNRIEFFCLNKMLLRGRLSMSKSARLGEPPLLDPDIRFGEILFETYVREANQYRPDWEGRPPVDAEFFAGFVGFVRSLVLRYYESGWHEKAQEKFDFLVKYYNDPSVYGRGLEAFVQAEYLAGVEMNDYPGAMRRVSGLVDRGIIHLAYDEDEEGQMYLTRAQQVYDRYQKSTVSDRNKIPFAFPEIVENMLTMRGSTMYRDSYLNACRKLGIQPLPDPSTMPAEPEPNAAGDNPMGLGP